MIKRMLDNISKLESKKDIIPRKKKSEPAEVKNTPNFWVSVSHNISKCFSLYINGYQVKNVTLQCFKKELTVSPEVITTTTTTPKIFVTENS